MVWSLVYGGWQVCYAISQLAAGFKDDESSPLSPYFKDIIQALLETVSETVSSFVRANQRPRCVHVPGSRSLYAHARMCPCLREGWKERGGDSKPYATLVCSRITSFQPQPASSVQCGASVNAFRRCDIINFVFCCC